MYHPTHFTIFGLEVLLAGMWWGLGCGLIPAISGYLFRVHRLLAPVLVVSNAFLWVLSEQMDVASYGNVCLQKFRELQDAGHELFGGFDCVGFAFDFELMARLLAWMLPAFLLGWAAAEIRFRLEKRKSANS
ncbi:hypothetical protein K3148_02110 [Qipengyuania aurantiaca]|uniref:DUF4281 domain-containing protein n=1 Tax=Qipengyuania aurantiaca TaxID=2867233 RepID=A0ABX8ZMK8_9SPHN|nr:hypothetical protein [Qipengyuania aurantiaca]QZD90222.1 hypothetical protein K3148_02110 [Qipengyuania aurantiaca]